MSQTIENIAWRSPFCRLLFPPPRGGISRATLLWQ